MIVSVIHASRGRPAKALATRRDYIAKARSLVDYMLVIDDDDGESARAFDEARVTFSTTPTRCGPGAYNAGARQALGSILVVAADDVIPPDGWDASLVERLGDGTRPLVLGVSDGHRTDRMMCHPILTRARWEQQGRVIFDPAFEAAGVAMFSDAVFSEAAYEDGVVVEARDLVFEHAHPAFNRGAWDETYRRGNDPHAYRVGGAIFRARFPRPKWAAQ